MAELSTMSSRMRLSVVLILSLSSMAGWADGLRTEFGGHTKFQVVGQSYPGDSFFRDFVGDNALDATADLRLNLNLRSGHWTFDTAYQLVGLQADSLAFAPLPNDDRRAMDMSRVIHRSGDSAILHRLDRLSFGYTSEKTVVRFGRQALSWGNGLFYAPMDLVNPFDPAAIDTEYKAGDDMVYLQYLRDNGDDLQAAYVMRRSLLTGNIERDDATLSLKYHGFAGVAEYDLLVAQSYGDPVFGVGIGRGIGGANWSADLVLTDTALETHIQLVSNLMYSWTWAGKNMSGAVEYYFNGFGQKDGAYDPASLAMNPDLLVRIARGELFAIGRHYFAGSIMIEMTPLWNVTPTLLANLADPSGLFQFVTRYSLADNMTLLGSINLPLGPNGSEFGGIESGIQGRFLATGPGVFAQIAWYF